MKNEIYSSDNTLLFAAGLSTATCWYCDHHVPHGQRFCGRDCAEAFEDDDRAAERRALVRQREISAMLV